LKKQFAICAALLLLGFGTARLAQAQSVYTGPGYSGPGYVGPGYMGPGAQDAALSPYEIMSIVRSTGLAPLTRPMRRGPYYVLVAVDRVGRQMRVMVDAQLGDIVNLRPASAYGSYGPEPGRPSGVPAGAPPLPEGAGTPAAYGAHPGVDAPPPPPPRSIPNFRAANPPSIASPPTRLAVAEPALPPPPPLPRPRPKVALNDAPAPAPAAAAPVAPAAASPPAPTAAPPSPAPSGAGEAAKPIE